MYIMFQFHLVLNPGITTIWFQEIFFYQIYVHLVGISFISKNDIDYIYPLEINVLTYKTTKENYTIVPNFSS